MVANLKSERKSVLFVLIGWANRYDGTELVVGGHRHLQLQENQNKSAEAKAFLKNADGSYRCGIGDGQIYESPLDIVFVARNPETFAYQVAGVYRNVEIQGDGKWKFAVTKSAVLYSNGKRPKVPEWPSGQGMRRWARRISITSGRAHEQLLSVYRKLPSKMKDSSESTSPENLEMEAFEGKKKILFKIHRQREAKLRSAKIQSAINNGGELVCEVPRCNFNFRKVYGSIGERFAVVHHLVPFSEVSAKGRMTSLNELAIVCANCHAMIHRGGACRPLESLIPNGKKQR